MKRLRTLVTGLSLVVVACALAPQRATPHDSLALEAAPVDLAANGAEDGRLGSLAWRGGLALRANNGAFGGWSGLVVSPDGRRLTAIGDKGSWFEATLDYDSEGHLAGLREARIDGIRGLDGMAVSSTAFRDAEAVARQPDGGLLVAFEQRHRLWRYPPGARPLAGAAQSVPAPASLRQAPGNNGAEAMAELADGRLLILTEGLARGEHRLGFLRAADGGDWDEVAYPRRGGFKPTAAAQLPDGDLLVLERRFALLEGFSARLRRVPLAAVRPGELLDGPVIASFEPPVITDNYEGLAVRRGERGETLVYLLSDDNFNGLQRTLLLMFALDPAEG